MTGPVLSPQEIVSNLRDSGVIDQATAILLEQRITAYAESRAAQGREEGKLEALIDAVKKAEATATADFSTDSERGGRPRTASAIRGDIDDLTVSPSRLFETAREGPNAARTSPPCRDFVE